MVAWCQENDHKIPPSQLLQVRTFLSLFLSLFACLSSTVTPPPPLPSLDTHAVSFAQSHHLPRTVQSSWHTSPLTLRQHVSSEATVITTVDPLLTHDCLDTRTTAQPPVMDGIRPFEAQSAACLARIDNRLKHFVILQASTYCSLSSIYVIIHKKRYIK